MSPSGSRRGRAEGGFTMTEVLVTMVVAGLLGLSLVRFYKDSYHTYSQQEQIADRNQNAHYTLNKFVEVLQQAGSALPDTGWTVISQSRGVLTVGLNPRGGEQFNGFDLPPDYFIPVTDGSAFANSANVLLNTTHVLIDYADPSKTPQKFPIDLAYNKNGFINGVKDNPTGLDSVKLSVMVNLSAGDRIYGYREDQYLLVGSDLVIRPNGSVSAQMVLAENIDSVGFTFLTATGATTTKWKWMRSASITVRARTEKPDPRIPAPGYHLISLPMNVLLRNKT